jgi:hypothetical protein
LKNIGEIRVKDKNNDANNVIKIVIGIYDMNFHIIQGKLRSGKNANKDVDVQAINGRLYSLIDKMIECLGENQFFIFSLAHSIITIIVSIVIPKEIIRLKFVKKFKVNHN